MQKVMGTEFWWFYDVIAIAAVLVCVFISGKSGAIKSTVNLLGYCLILILSFSISGVISNGIYEGNIRATTVRRIEKHLSDDWLPERSKTYIDSLDYIASPKPEKLKEIFSKECDYDAEIYKYLNNINAEKADEEAAFTEKMDEGYALMIKELVASELNTFTAESAAEKVRKDKEGFYELIPLLQTVDNPKLAATALTDDYIAPAYTSILRLLTFVIMFVILLVIWVLAVRVFMGKKGEEGALSNIVGGVLGIIKGGIIVFVIAAMVRLSVILGNDEMLFFNFDAIDKSIIFKHLYQIVLKM